MVRQADEERRNRFGEFVLEAGFRHMHLLDAVEFRQRHGGLRRTLAENEPMHGFAQLFRGRQRTGRHIVEMPVLLFGEEQGSHQSIPTSDLSLPTSSATDATLMPPLRLAGSTVFRTVRRGVTSTP